MKKNGDFYYEDNKRYTVEEYHQIQYAENQVKRYDLLQLTKKIQLKN